MSAAALVKELRKLTGSPVIHCKTAIQETGGDIPKAIEWLRAKGISQAHKKLNKDVSAGLVGLMELRGRVVMLETLCETDFVAKTDQFQAFAMGTLRTLCGNSAWTTAGLMEEAKRIQMEKSLDVSIAAQTIEEARLHTISKTQENVAIRRALNWSAGPTTIIGKYLHNTISAHLGASGCVLKLVSPAPFPAQHIKAVQDLADKLCMQVIATKPIFLSREQVTEKYLETERSAVLEKLDEKLKQKPQELVNKVVSERVNKSLEQAVLLDQTFVISEDPEERKVKDTLLLVSTQLQVPLAIEDFKVMFCGEALD